MTSALVAQRYVALYGCPPGGEWREPTPEERAEYETEQARWSGAEDLRTE